MRKTVFIKNAAVLTVCSVILRLLGIVFKIWVAAKVGSEGMGLYSIVISVYFLFSAFSSTGICTAVTRLCGDNITLGKDYRGVFKKCIFLSLVTGVLSGAVMTVFSGAVSRLAVGDGSVAICFCVYALCLPATGLSSCIRGYFFAVRLVTNSAVSQIAEQVIRITVSYFLVKKFIVKGAEFACLALVIGDTVSEIICPLILYLRYRKSTKKSPKTLKKCTCSYKTVLRIAFPLTAGRYISLLLRTAENFLLPRTLKQNGMDIKGGLSALGCIKAMALPVLLFPSGILSSVSMLLVPEISSSVAQKRHLVVKDLTERIIKFTLTVSVIFSCIFMNTGNELGNLLYKNNEAGFLLTVLSPLVPLMYLDVVADGILKGLDCQKFCFYTGVTDSTARVVLILIFVPVYGIKAFIITMYISNFFTAFLNTFMLLKKSKGGIDPIKSVFIPLCSSIVITKATALFFKNAVAGNDCLFVIAVTAVSFALCFGVLLITGSITPDEIKDLIA